MPLLLLLLAFPFVAFADMPPDFVSYSPDCSLQARLVVTRDKEIGGSDTAVTISDRAGHPVFSETLTSGADGVRWTVDGKFLIIPTIAGNAGRTKTPWRYYFYIISIESRQWRWFAGSEQTPFVSAEVWCQAPDTIILVGHTAEHGIEPPDDPILLRYKVSDLWLALPQT